MKKVLIVLIALIVAFILIWTIKLNSPLSPNDPYANGVNDEQPWWETSNGEAPTADSDWILDHEIPSNYIPVIGRDELYMVIDDEGNIIKYRQRTKQTDGSWTWEDIDPNIPQNYEPVEGLENVYKTTDVDGTVHYYKYTRNDDDTYFFTEVDKYGNPLVDDTPSGDTIPKNYIRVEGNIYAVYNEYGVLIGYKERIQNADGSYTWIDVNYSPSTSSNTIVNGSGAIPGASTTNTQTSTGNITIINEGGEKTQKGYSEEEVYTDTQHKDGWVIVYETIVTRKYNESGDLVSTSKEGPTEINRFPETEVNSNILK
jgi:hypothetical protein